MLSTARSLQDLSKSAPSPHGAVLQDRALLTRAQAEVSPHPQAQELSHVVGDGVGRSVCGSHSIPGPYRAEWGPRTRCLRTRRAFHTRPWSRQGPLGRHRPDVEVERHGLLDLQPFPSLRELKYAVLRRLGVVLHQLAVEEPAGSRVRDSGSLGSSCFWDLTSVRRRLTLQPFQFLGQEGLGTPRAPAFLKATLAFRVSSFLPRAPTLAGAGVRAEQRLLPGPLISGRRGG